MGCTEACWTAKPCPVCGDMMPPRGRSVPLAMHQSECCTEQPLSVNPRHLWNIHDSCRAYTDPHGWEAHVASCEQCKEES